MAVLSNPVAVADDSVLVAAKIIEAIVGNAWATNSVGQFTYVTPTLLARLGLTLQTLNGALEEGAVAWKSLVHADDYAKVDTAWRHSLKTGEPYEIEARMFHGQGVYARARCSGRATLVDGGRIAGWHGALILTEGRGEASPHESKQDLPELVDLVPIHIWRLSPDGEPTFHNSRLDDFLGFKVEDVVEPGMTRFDAMLDTILHPDDVARYRTALKHYIATGEHFSMRARLRRADGSYRWLESRAEPVRDEAGAITQWFGANLDIDDVVRVQEALRDREQAMSRLVEVVPAAICRLDRRGEPTFFNRRLIDFLGVDVTDYDRPDMGRLATIIADSVHPEDRDLVDNAVSHAFATGEPYAMKYRLRRADGVYRWTETRGEPLRKPGGEIVEWYSVSIDIDDQIRLYSDVAEREAKIRRLVDSDVIGIVIWDLDGTLIDANDAFLRMVQYERSDVEAGLRWFDMTPPDWQEVHAQEEARELAETGKMEPREKEYFRKDGSRVPILIGAACFEGQSQQGVAFILDLTERKRVEEALRESERSLWELVETLPVMIDCASPDGEPIFRSRRLREFLGYNLEDLDRDGSRLEATLDEGVHPDDLAGVKEHYARCLAMGEPYARRHRLRRFDGEYRWVETRAAPMRNGDGQIVQWNVICLDIHAQVQVEEELRLAQERLARASQAASLAELSASIAHEVNQPLAAVVANSNACQRWLNADPPNLARAQTTIERIIRDANSAAEVVSSIRALFKQTVEPRAISKLSAVVSEVRELMSDTAQKAKVIVTVEVDPTIPEVEFDPVQIQQVLVNLWRNAVEAMSTHVGPRRLQLSVRPAGDTVEFEVSDTGPGVAQPEKVLDSFYTTKDAGMGMGLAISRSIVESHGGRLWFDRNSTGGSTFHFTLPLRAPEAS